MFKNFSLPVLLVCLLNITLLTASDTVSAAEPLPTITLEVPENSKYKEYLGLEGAPGEPFSLTDIKTDILIIELFSMYCPYCQAEAPRVNDLYKLLEEQSKNGAVVKIIGLGASNTPFEVDHFKDTFDVQFPLFADKDLSLYKTLKGEGTPGFLGCVVKEGKDPVIVLRNSGGFDSAEDFLTELLQKSVFE